MANRQGKLRIESLEEFRNTFGTSPGAEFCLLVRGERKVEIEIDQKVVAELMKLLQKVGGNRRNEDY